MSKKDKEETKPEVAKSTCGPDDVLMTNGKVTTEVNKASITTMEAAGWKVVASAKKE